MEEKSNKMVVADKGAVSYQVAGQEVKLSYGIVKSYLTRGNNNISDQEAAMFIGLCKFSQYNPFLGEAYLVKYKDAPAQMIVSKEAYFKRADSCPNYEGIQAGIIVEREGAIVELEGCFYGPKDKLVGGWAKVFRSDRKYPVVQKVNLSEYDKNQSIWNEKKSTMICKIAKVQALREAFPNQLGAMYTLEEQGKVQIDNVPAGADTANSVQFEDVTEHEAKEVEKVPKAAKKETAPEPAKKEAVKQAGEDADDTGDLFNM